MQPCVFPTPVKLYAVVLIDALSAVLLLMTDLGTTVTEWFSVHVTGTALLRVLALTPDTWKKHQRRPTAEAIAWKALYFGLNHILPHVHGESLARHMVFPCFALKARISQQGILIKRNTYRTWEAYGGLNETLLRIYLSFRLQEVIHAYFWQHLLIVDKYRRGRSAAMDTR